MSSDSAAIGFRGVAKRYHRHRGSRHSLRGLIFSRAVRRAEREEARYFWALHDVSFDVRPGSTTGLIGGNGAGKSTVLRLAAGLTAPTGGAITVPRDMMSVLALGGNFDGTLTGRENAMTALVVNGASRRQAAGRIPAVLEFAELEDFFDSPVRAYSAGMVLRLAFAVAVQHRAKAFLVDEVLSVGDLRFQEKCVGHLNDLRAGGATVLMASHDLAQVGGLCDEAIWLQAGRVRKSGPAEEVVAAYEDASRSETMERTPPPRARAGATGGLELRRNRFGSQELRITNVRLNDAPEARLEPGATLQLSARVEADETPRRALLGVTVRRAADSVELINEHVELGSVVADQEVSLELVRLDLAPGSYLVDVGLYEIDWSYAYDYHWGVYRLDVAGRPSPGRLLHPPVRWSTREVDTPP